MSRKLLCPVNSPSPAALRAAAKIQAAEHVELLTLDEMAAIIDAECATERAALLLAQAVVDSEYDAGPGGNGRAVGEDELDNLREALTTIRKQASSAHAEVQTTSINEPPQAGENAPGSPP